MVEEPSEQAQSSNRTFTSKEQYWLGHSRRWQQSGLSLAGYARSQGLVVNTFYAWHDRLRKRGLVKSEPAPTVFHRVTVKPTEPSTFSEERGASLRFRLPNGIDCEVALDFDNVTGFLEKLSRLR